MPKTDNEDDYQDARVPYEPYRSDERPTSPAEWAEKRKKQHAHREAQIKARMDQAIDLHLDEPDQTYEQMRTELDALLLDIRTNNRFLDPFANWMGKI